MTESQIFISNRCFEKGKRQVLLSPRSSKITVTKEKEEEKEKARGRKEGEEKKSNGCTISFYNSFFGNSSWTQKGPFSDTGFKNPARYTTKEKRFHLLICCTSTVLVSVLTSLVASHV